MYSSCQAEPLIIKLNRGAATSYSKLHLTCIQARCRFLLRFHFFPLSTHETILNLPRFHINILKMHWCALIDALLLFTKSCPRCLMKTVLNKDTEGAIIAQADGWGVGWNVKVPRPPFWFKKVPFLKGRHAVIEVFTTRQECDGIENVGDSDAWLGRLLCTDCRAALWIVMPHFIVLRLKGLPLRELHYSTPCSFWYSSPQNKDRVSTARRTPSRQFGKLRNALWQDTDQDW